MVPRCHAFDSIPQLVAQTSRLAQRSEKDQLVEEAVSLIAVDFVRCVRLISLTVLESNAQTQATAISFCLVLSDGVQDYAASACAKGG